MFSTYDAQEDSSFEHPIKKNWEKHYQYLIQEDKDIK